MRAVLTNLLTGDHIDVVATTEHPDSSYGKAVWVDDNGIAYAQVGMPIFGYKIDVIDEV